MGDVQRCFTVFHPPTRASEVLPVVLAPNCYAKDKLQGIEALNAKSDGNAAAVRFGFARIGLSTPDGAWTFGKLSPDHLKDLKIILLYPKKADSLDHLFNYAVKIFEIKTYSKQN